MSGRARSRHEDSLGNKGRTEAGDVQVMSAGTGIRHAEYNREKEPTRIFQIWIIPDAARRRAVLGRAAVPASSDRSRPLRRRSRAARGRRRRPADPRRRARARRDGSKPARRSNTSCARGRHAYLVPASGAVEVNGVRVDARDGAAIRDESSLRVTALDGDAEFVLVDSLLSARA